MRWAFLFEILLGLKKAYDALDWDRCLEIIAAYRVGPRVFRPLQTYWDWLTMVARAGIHFRLPFKDCLGVTQGDPLYPMLFNLVMDAVICHWVMVVAATEEGTENIGILIWYLAA